MSPTWHGAGIFGCVGGFRNARDRGHYVVVALRRPPVSVGRRGGSRGVVEGGRSVLVCAERARIVRAEVGR